MTRKLLACLLTVAPYGCGGGSPSGPSPVNPPPVTQPPAPTGSIRLAEAPSPGSKIKVNQFGLLVAPKPRFEIEIIYSQAISSSGVVTEFKTASGKSCALGVSSSKPLQANTPTRFSLSTMLFNTECGFPTTTTQMFIGFGGGGVARMDVTLHGVKYLWVR